MCWRTRTSRLICRLSGISFRSSCHRCWPLLRPSSIARAEIPRSARRVAYDGAPAIPLPGVSYAAKTCDRLARTRDASQLVSRHTRDGAGLCRFCEARRYAEIRSALPVWRLRPSRRLRASRGGVSEWSGGGRALWRFARAKRCAVFRSTT